MDLDFLYDEKFLAKTMGKDALAVQDIIEGLKAKNSNDLVEKLLLLMSVQACVTTLPQLTPETTQEFKAIIDLKKMGLSAASKIYNDEFTADENSILSAKDFEDEAL